MATQESISGYSFSILSEDVAPDDLFEDRTHKRVSENIYRIINQSEKGVTIGLEGSWGSGKSTVINLLRDKLKKTQDDKTLFFMFDAWAHDGDPLRRIFLESLIREIDPEESNNDLQKICRKITGRKKTVEIKSKKSASRLGKLISLFALLIPLGSALIAQVNYDQLVSPYSKEAGEPHYQFIIGLFLCLSPIAVILYWIFKGDKHSKYNVDIYKINLLKIKSWPNLWKSKSWEFFSTESEENYTQDITENGERTSIEFEDYFKCIVKSAMDHKLIDRCIIVIDNLDRVNPDHAKNIWSTLQTFFQRRSSRYSSDLWSDKVWFIIPFDRDGFIKIWNSNSEIGEIGSSFLKKCFQLIAEVPLPVMSGWSKYAETCICEALNQWPENEKEAALSTYVRYASRLDESPTPRDIKIFSNQIGLLGSMWGGQVSVEAMSLYILFKETYTTHDLRKNLVSGRLPKDFKTNMAHSEICAELAGLMFGVSKKKGIQLLLGPEIRSALKNGDGKALTSLLDDHGEAFWIAYEASREDWAVKTDHTDEYKISMIKAFREGLASNKYRIRHDITNLSEVLTRSFDKLDFTKFDYSFSFDSLIELNLEKDNFIISVSELLKQKIKLVVNSVGNEKFDASVLPNIQKMVDLLIKNGKPLPNSRYLHLNSNNWKIWLSHLQASATSFNFVFPKDETIRALVKESQLDAATPNHDSLRILSKTFEINPASSEWDFASDKIASWMTFPNRAKDYEDIYHLSIKLSSCQDGKYFSKFKSSLEDPNFWVIAQSESCDKNPSLPILAAIIFEEDLQKNENVSPLIKSFWADTNNIEKLEEIFLIFKSLNCVDTIWMLLRDKRNKAAEIIVRNIEDSALFSSAQGTIFLDSYSLDNEEIIGIAKKFSENNTFFVYQDDMKKNPLVYQSIYKIFKLVDNLEISAFIDNEIRNINEETWLECIEKNGDLLDIVNNKNPHFSNALRDYLISIVSGIKSIDSNFGLVKRLPGLLEKVTDLNKSFIPKLIRCYFDNEKDHLNDDIFDIISPLFCRHLVRIEEYNLTERVCVWIKTNKLERIKWFIEQDIKEVKDPSENLIELIKLWIHSNEPELNDIASKLTIKLGLIFDSPDLNEGTVKNSVSFQ